MNEPIFQNREGEIHYIVFGLFVLLFVCGETGIGKSRLLKQCASKMQAGGKVVPFFIDLEKIRQEQASPKEALLRAIIQIRPDMFEGVWQNPEQVAGLIASRLNAQVSPSVALIFDTVEALQFDRDFWDWLEKNLLRPLVSEKKVKIIFSGRTPVRWLDFEVRRNAEPVMRLKPLGKDAPDSPASHLVYDLLREQNFTSKDTTGEYSNEKLVETVLNLSFGHPKLIEQLIDFLSKQGRPAEDQNLEFVLCSQVVAVFIEQSFFTGVEPKWQKLLWWISILDHFDTSFLKSYLNEVVPEEVTDWQEYQVLQGIHHLHEQSILVWKENEGEQFQGVMGKIIARCFAVTRKTDYLRANRAAASTYRRLKDDFLQDEEDLKLEYEQQALSYEQRAMSMEAA